MAWRAELIRRRWYCINGFDMITWYSNFLYDEWWNSLSEEQRQKIENYRRNKREREQREARMAVMRLMFMSCMIAGISERTRHSNNVTYSDILY